MRLLAAKIANRKNIMKLTTKILKKLIREELNEMERFASVDQSSPEQFENTFKNSLKLHSRDIGVTPDMYEIRFGPNPDYVAIHMPQLPPSSKEVQGMKNIFKSVYGSQEVQIVGIFEKGAQNMVDMPTGSKIQVEVGSLRKQMPTGEVGTKMTMPSWHGKSSS
jgi:hypothetical protein